MPKRAIFYANKALKLPKLNDKDRFTLAMYKVEATVQLGNNKAALVSLKEAPKLESSLKCSFGYASPWVDRTVDYTAKLLLQANYVAVGLLDEAESQSKDMADQLKALSDLNDQKALKGVTPISTNLLYSCLRRGRQISKRPAEGCTPVPETPQASFETKLKAKPTLTNDFVNTSGASSHYIQKAATIGTTRASIHRPT